MKDLNEHYFGLIEKLYPGNDPHPDLRGQVVDVDVTGDGSRDYAENYASACSAFFMSSSGYGAFFDTFAKGRYQFAVNGFTRIDHTAGSLDWHLFYGPSGDRIHEQYFKVIGRPKTVPVWACGPIFWRDVNRGGSAEILGDVRKFTELRIPLTACWVDRPYSNGAHEWSRMDFSGKFAEPASWIRTLGETFGLRFMTWVGPMTFQDSAFPGLLPGDRGYIDLTDPGALAEFESRLNRNQYAVGVRGHKMDRGDEAFPLTAPWRDPVSESEARNKYAYLYSKTIHEFLTRAHGADQFNFARAAYHRCQPFLSAVWGGDSRSNWQGMSGSQANAMRCGFMGFPVWGSDTGGYLGPGRIDDALYTRWLQWSAWCGMFEIKIDGSGGEGGDRPPWKCTTRVQNAFRDACILRMDLLPTVYSAANTSYKNGVLMQPLAYRFPWDERTYDVWDEYLFCGAFLVAPVFSAASGRTVYLPGGRWIDFADPRREYSGPVEFETDVPLESIPVFVRGNSIYLTGCVYRGNSRVWEGGSKGDETIVIHAFPGLPGDSTVFDYVDRFDGDGEKTMRLSRPADDRIVFNSEALSTPATIEIRCNAKPGKALLNGKPVKIHDDAIRRTVSVGVPKRQSIRVELMLEPGKI
jgi:alpha-glucosidase (family GH31 glycosyl hydrolase)